MRTNLPLPAAVPVMTPTRGLPQRSLGSQAGLQRLLGLLLALLLTFPTLAQRARTEFQPVQVGQPASRSLTPAPPKAAATANRPTGVLAAPVASNIFIRVAPNAANAVIRSVEVTDADGNAISTYTYIVPAGFPGTLGAFNPTTNAITPLPASATTTVNVNPNSGLVFQPTAGFVGNAVFTYRATDNTGAVSNTATYNIGVTNIIAKPQTAQFLLSTFGATQLSLPLVGSGGTITDFVINALPDAASGVLLLNNVPVTAGQVISTANAGNLFFDPIAGFFGNATFTYSARDNTGALSPANYGIPVSQGTCGSGPGQRTALDFTTRPVGEDFMGDNKMVTADGVTITANPTGFPFIAGTPNVTNSFNIQDVNGLPGKGIAWQEDYSAGATKSSTATFSFSRPLSNFSLTMGDIDRNFTANANEEFIDRVTFNGFDANGNLVALSAANVRTGVANTYSGGNVVTAVANSTSDPANNVVVTFPVAISRITITYENATANADAGFQFTVIPQFSWCSQADIVTTLVGPVSAPANTTVTYTTTTTNNGSDAANGVIPTLTLVPNLPAGSVALPAGASYNPGTGVVTFATIGTLATGSANAVTNTVTFTMPATGQVMGTAASTAIPQDPALANNNGTAPAAQVTTTVAPNTPPVAQNVTNAPAIPNSNAATALAPLSATDADGNVTVASFTIVTLPSPTQGTLLLNGSPVNPGQVVTVAQAGQLTFAPVSTFVGNATFTYTATDNQGAASANTATYTIPVSAGSADVATTISGPTSATAGQTVTYTATSTNNGPNPAASAVATIQLPVGTTGVVVTNGAYNASTGVVTFDPVTLANGASVVNTVSFVANATTTGQTASSSPTADPVAANNNGTAAGASVTTTVTPATAAGGMAGPCAPAASIGSYGDATSGPSTVQLFYAVANHTTSGNTIVLTGDNVFNSSSTTINTGELLLIVQMQGADINGTNTSAYGDGVAGGSANGNLVDAAFRAGQYEYAVANAAVSIPNNGTVNLTLTQNLRNVYVNADATTSTGQRRFQVIRVPQYRTLSLNANVASIPWNGRFGGVIAYDVVGQMSFNGFGLDASGAGFRGGAGRALGGDGSATGTDYRELASKNVHASKGEGTAGTPRFVNNRGAAPLDNGTAVNGYLNGSSGRGAPGNAGGGGTDANPAANDQNTGGAGGANGGLGGRGGNSWNSNQPVGGEPGAAFPVASTSRLVMGGGGGAGTSNDGTGTGGAGFASSGAAGGGLVFLRVGSVAGTGSIRANGANADNSVLNDGSGGGGAGGSVLLTSNTTTGLVNITLQANGGNGGTNNPGGADAHGPGGGGGGGIVFANGSVANASSANGGANGITNSTAFVGAYGAQPGTRGVLNTQIGTVVANSTSGINCSVDLTSTVTGPASAAPGTTVNLLATFANNGGTTANTVARRVEITGPIGMVITAPGGTVGAYNAGAGTYTITYPALAALAGGSSTSFPISYTAPATGPVDARSFIATTGTPADAVPANNNGFVRTDIANTADVTTTLSGPTTLYAGQPSGTYTATFTNNGPSTASNVTQRVTLPAGVTNVLVNGAPFTPVGGVIDFGTAATLANGATNTFTYSFTAPTTPTAANTPVNMTSNVASTPNNQGGNAAPDAATLALTVLGTANVQATISAQNATVTAGGTGANQGQFNATFANTGAAAAANPSLQVQLMPGLTNVTIGALAGYTASYNPTTGLVSYAPNTANPIAANTTIGTSTIRFDVPVAGPVTATAVIGTSSNEAGQTANNTDSAVISVTPRFDLQTSIVGPATVPANGVVTYDIITFNATNAMTAGSVSPAPAVVQTVQLPVGLTNVFVSNAGVYNSATGLVTFPTLPSLAPGASVNNVISYSPTAAASAFTATATATPNTTGAGDLATGNNSSSVTTTVGAATATANLYTLITTPSANVAPNAPIVFTVTSGNDGLAAVTGLAQTVSLPAGLTGVTITGGPAGFTASNANYNPVTGVVTFPTITGPVGPATAYTYTITVAAPASGVLAAVSTIGSNSSDPMPSNNVSAVNVTVNATSNDVATTITGPTTATAGQAVTYTVTTTNNGPAATTNTQTVTIPAGLTPSQVTFSGPNAGGAMYNATTGVVTFNTNLNQAPGTSLENTVTFLAPTAGTLTAAATVLSAGPDNVPANNSARTSTAVSPVADFTVAINGPAATVAAGNPVTYAVTTTNNGPSVGGQTTTVQLPVGLANVTVSGGGSYNSTTGVVTFPAVAVQQPGAAGALVNFIRFNASAAPEITATAMVTPTAASNDPALNNNSATAITTVGPLTAASVDVQTTVTSNVASQTAGAPVVFTVTTVNASTTDAAAQVSQRLLLPAGLTGVSISGPNGATAANYDPATGVVTFPLVASMPANTTYTYTVTANAPGTDPLVATAVVTDNTTDPTPANNVASTTVFIAPRVDVLTAVVGPAQVQPNNPVTYTVTTLNNGPSTATDVTTTVQLPAGLTGVVVSGDGTYNPTTGVVTFPTLATQAVGTAGQVINTITFTTSTFSYTVTSNVLADGDVVPANNTAAQNTQVNVLPVALAIVNSLQAPQGNTAGQLPLSSLQGTDTDPGMVVQYVITSLPAAAPGGVSPGILYFNGTPVTVGTLVTDPTKLTFDPASDFVGNAFFTYAAIDNQNGQSVPALYTIPVGQDVASVYTTIVRGGSANPYQNGDVVASVFDVNGGKYSSTGTVTPANDGNGIVTASMPATGPAGNPANALPPGIAFDPATGLFTVSNRLLLMAGNYPLRITTVDPFGGITTQDIILTIGAFPLPVELTDFTAQAVRNVDALLKWQTASEKSNEYFDVERSITGADFVKIGRVQGQGNATSVTNYTLTDAGIGRTATGQVYYRLRQVDLDGTVSFSSVRTVAFTNAATPELSLFPNPAASTTTLDLSQLPTGTYRVSVLDATGRTVLGATLQAGLGHTLDLKTVASGTYTVLVRGQAGNQFIQLTKRLVKE